MYVCVHMSILTGLHRDDHSAPNANTCLHLSTAAATCIQGEREIRFDADCIANSNGNFGCLSFCRAIACQYHQPFACHANHSLMSFQSDAAKIEFSQFRRLIAIVSPPLSR